VTVTIDREVEALGPGAVEAIEKAFVAWMQSPADVPVVTIEFGQGLGVAMEPDGVNAVVVAPIDVPGHEDDLAVTVGFSDSGTGEIVEADIIINEKHAITPLPQDVEIGTPPSALHQAENDQGHANQDDDWDNNRNSDDNWDDDSDSNYERETHSVIPSCTGDPTRGLSCSGRYDLESIIAHEVGHFYGLGEDNDDNLATMYYCTSQCETHKRSLELTDVGVMEEVYAAGYEDRGEVQCGIGAVGDTHTPWGATLLLGSLSLLFLRRRKAG
jgi:hypothetical protein